MLMAYLASNKHKSSLFFFVSCNFIGGWSWDNFFFFFLEDLERSGNSQSYMTYLLGSGPVSLGYIVGWELILSSIETFER